MKTVYLAGPITGCGYDEATSWRDYVSRNLLDFVKTVSPMRGKEFLKNEEEIGHSYESYEKEDLLSSAKHIFSRDFYDCTHCDMVFAYLPKEINKRRPSYGTVLEMGWANAYNIPVVLITNDHALYSHPLVHNSVSFLTDSIEDGIKIVNSVLRPYVEKDTGYQVTISHDWDIGKIL